jgi:SAM-dependent methyltransferase
MSFPEVTFFGVLQFVGIIVLGSAAIAGISAAPWVPTRKRERTLLLKEVDLRPGMRVVDLGCGDGAFLFAAAKHFPDVVFTGYDISFLPLAIAYFRKGLSFKRYRNVHIKFGNLFTQDISDFDVVFAFLLSKCYPRLKHKLAREMKPEAIAVFEAWALEGVEPSRTVTLPGVLPIFFYRPADLQRTV